MDDPSNPLGAAVWQRGAKLGAVWAVIFFVTMGMVYLALGVLGWSDVLRALCAMVVGPVLGTGMIAAWWVIRRPSLVPPEDDGSLGGGKIEDGE